MNYYLHKIYNEIQGCAIHTTGDCDVNKFLKLEGVTQGLIKGSVTQKGKEGMISVLSFSHEVNSIYDPIGVIVHKLP